MGESGFQKEGRELEDREILSLYWQRREEAIRETDRKYSPYCSHIAMNILADREDTEECVSDTWLHVWNAIPPQRPSRLGVWLGKLTRNLALDRWRARTAEKRGGGELPVLFSELEECVSGESGVEQALEEQQTMEAIRRFLGALPREKRALFLRRYYFGDSLEELGRRTGRSRSQVKSALFRLRSQLRDFLKEEGILI